VVVQEPEQGLPRVGRGGGEGRVSRARSPLGCRRRRDAYSSGEEVQSAPKKEKVGKGILVAAAVVDEPGSGAVTPSALPEDVEMASAS